MSKFGVVEYIGGGVYVKPMPGGGVEVMANSHETPTDKIWLDADVVRALVAAVKSANEEDMR